MKTALDTRFINLEQLIHEIQHWDLDFKLLDAGGFQGRIKQVVSRDVLVTNACFQRGLDQAGATPSGYRTFVILGKACNGFWWRGHQVTNNDLLVFPPSNELRSVSQKDFEVFTVSLRSARFEQLVNDLGLGSPPDKIPEVIQMEPQTIQGLRELAGIIVSANDRPVSMSAAQVLAEKLAVYTSKNSAARKPTLRKRDLAIKRVVEYVRNVPAPASDLTHLCHIAGVSERTLQYAFKERYGIPPNVFVKRWNLNSARRLLLQAGPATVIDIATSLGFSHQGHFTADYKKLFSELPSTTLESKR